MLGKPLKHFSYPFGSYNKETPGLVKQAGFESATTVQEGTVGKESDLFELFNGVGHVQNAEVVSYRHNQRSKGFAFVQMQTIEEAKRAVEELHDKEFLGRRLVVSGAKSEQH